MICLQVVFCLIAMQDWAKIGKKSQYYIFLPYYFYVVHKKLCRSCLADLRDDLNDEKKAEISLVIEGKLLSLQP